MEAHVGDGLPSSEFPAIMALSSQVLTTFPEQYPSPSLREAFRTGGYPNVHLKRVTTGILLNSYFIFVFISSNCMQCK